MRILVLAQQPPPVHGVTVMTARVLEAASAIPGAEVEHLWMGGAASLADINKATAGKAFAFLRLLALIRARAAAGRRHDVAYLTLAPWTRAALRDALLASAARKVADRVLIHLHGEGLDKLLVAAGPRERLLRRLLGGCELVTADRSAVALALQSGVFRAAHLLDNCAPDPGPTCREPRGGLKLGFLANLDPRKGVIRFVDALAAMADAGLPVTGLIAGPPTPWLAREDLQRLIDSKNLGGRVEIVGPVEGAAKDAFFRAIDLFLYLSTHDHAPLVLIEALSYGAIPIAFDQGAIKGMMSPAFAANVIPADLPEAQAIDAALALTRSYLDASRLHHDRETARGLYAARFGEARFAEALRHIVMDAAGDAERTH